MMPSCYAGTESERQALDAYTKLLRAADTISARVREHVTKFGLTESQFAVLEALHHLGPLRASDLARKLLRSGANITTVVDNLVKSGLVERCTCPNDRRGVHVKITAAGTELIARVFPSVAEHLGGLMGNLEAEEQVELARLCRKLGLASCGDDPSCS